MTAAAITWPATASGAHPHAPTQATVPAASTTGAMPAGAIRAIMALTVPVNSPPPRVTPAPRRPVTARAALRQLRAARVDQRSARRSQVRRLLNAAPSPAGRPEAMLLAIRVARALGCRVTENWAIGDPPGHSHTGGSKHYMRYPGTTIGRAIDVYCSPATKLRYFRWAEQHRRRIFLDDLFYDPVGYSYDAGKVWRVVIGGHRDHVHLSI